MKMKLKTEYKCDKCGEILEKEKTATLSTNFAPAGIVGYKQGNMGVRHMCSFCKRTFEMAFKGFFTAYNDTEKLIKTLH